MANPSSDEIATFLREQYLLWNDQKRDELMAYFRRMAPNGFTIEYVGRLPQDGEQAMEEMFAQYGGKCRTDLLQLLVNGNEAATYVDNRFVDTDVGMPSIETYKFEDGRMQIRYFHQA
ncbi:hypothetical protein ACFB49_23120 [Sphingomonas sp. DBB INV C78]|uniref:hypothetical protein n=1 Tax=Sphingomonas sp. DBB INV C78 TaxID=3349434 RepID=UPI0036D353FD